MPKPPLQMHSSVISPAPPLHVLRATAGTTVYPPQGKFGPRMQHSLQLVLLHSGEVTIKLDDKERYVPASHVALLRPGHREEFAFAAEQETWHRWITVRTEPMNEEALLFWEALPDMLPLTERINNITDLMLSLQGNDREQNQEALSALGQAAMLLYAAECRMQEAQRSSHPSVLKSKALIQRSYRENLGLSGLAAAANVTTEHLIRLFRKYEGVTPAQYLWSYRIERGLNLLRNTGLSVGEIAEQCGFKTSFHFARSVKRHTGMTPTEVRNQSWLGGHGQGK